MKRRLPAHVDADDLIGAGLLGLAQAAAHCHFRDPNAFIAYAIRRAMGGMIDELRKNDQLTRLERRLASRLARTERQLANSLGRPPEIDEIARELEMSSDQVEDARSRTSSSEQVSLSATESMAPTGSSSEPERELNRAQLENKLHRALNRLPDRLRSVVDMSCAEDLTLRQIGARLGVTEARACQLRKQAVDQLRSSCADSILPPAFASAA